MRASIRQVAERAQVSRMTVSRVVRGRRNQVNEETYERVLEAMRELNYVPVRSSFQNHHVETHVIGLVPYHRNPSRNQIDSKTYEGICDMAGRNGYDLFIMLRGEAEWMANREEVRFLDRRSDGFIFISPGSGEWQTALEALAKNNIPAVVCYRRDVPEGVAWVDADNEQIMHLAVDHLMEHGHRRLLYLGGPLRKGHDEGLLANVTGTRPNFDDAERRRHFESAIRFRGLNPDDCHQVTVTDPEWQLSRDEVRAIVESGATGIVCVNDYLGVQLWDILESAGLRVPEDISLISVDNEFNAAHRGLTTVEFGYDEVGRLAVESWIQLSSGDEAADCCRAVPVTLIERSSVAPPRLGNLSWTAFN